MTEDQLEQEALAWLADVGYTHAYGPDIAHDGPHPERTSYRQVLLPQRLREAINRLNPTIPTAAREDALKQVMDLGMPALMSANQHFHRLLVTGVPVQYQKDGETRGDFVRLIDWATPERNEWLAVNQYSIRGPHHTRRPDIILFVNGLPLVLIELKNPADEKADVWKTYDQIQTYKEQIPDVFQTNELLVISDGTEALLGSLSADPERFMAWRTIDGLELDPLGEFNELQTLVRGVLAPAYLLVVDSHVTAVRADGNGNLSWPYLGQLMMRMQPEIEAMGEGSTGQTELSRSKLADIAVLVPLVSILTRFDDFFVPLKDRIAVNETSAQTLATLRDTLLPRLISGQLRLDEAKSVNTKNQ